MKDELCKKIMTVFSALRSKTYCYLTDDNDEKKNEKGTKKCIIRRKLKFEDFKKTFKVIQLDNIVNQ